MNETTTATLAPDVPEMSWSIFRMPVFSPAPVSSRINADSVKQPLNRLTDSLMASLPAIDRLSAEERRGMIARYSSVLEGNFIYWMTGAYLAAKSEEARSIILENLHDEVRDSHPHMLRKFTMAAYADPKDTDALAIFHDLTEVRLFIGRLSPAPILTMMAFFEGFIQRFMPYLAELAKRQGSKELEYTNVHGFCDVTHSQELFRALSAEIALDPAISLEQLLEGVQILQPLIHSVFWHEAFSVA
jgi:hypothetical protein